MPKQKTNKAAAKRFFKVTKTGKVKHQMAGKRHINTKMTAKRIRNLRKAAFVYTTEAKTMRTLIPYK